MNIAIDASQIVYETGVSSYTRNLIENLLKLKDGNSYVIFGSSLRQHRKLSEELNSLTIKHPNKSTQKQFLIPPILSDLIWNRVRSFRIDNLIGKVDVFHSSDWTQPPSGAFKVTTIHDLVPILFPNLSHPKIVSVHKKRLEIIKKEVDRIIVPSESTKDDLLKLGFDKNNVRVIPEAPDNVFKRISSNESERIKRKYKIFGKYLLSVGVTPRKNTERIIEAFEKFRHGKNTKLVIIGHIYGKYDQQRGVIFLGHVDSRDIPGLYKGAEALLYPSLYEGFGLPILEAFSVKTPVVTSNIGSMKEVAKDGARLVDPYSIDSIIEGIEEVLENRKNYIKKGSKIVSGYTWSNNAQLTLKVYEESLK